MTDVHAGPNEITRLPVAFQGLGQLSRRDGLLRSCRSCCKGRARTGRHNNQRVVLIEKSANRFLLTGAKMVKSETLPRNGENARLSRRLLLRRCFSNGALDWHSELGF